MKNPYRDSELRSLEVNDASYPDFTHKKHSRSLSTVWNILGLTSLVGAIIIYTACALTDWRVTEQIKYHYMDGGTVKILDFDKTYFGLYLVAFSKNLSISTWRRLQRFICDQVTLAAPASQFIDIFHLGGCKGNCMSHFMSRCNGYKILNFWSTTAICVLTISATIAMICSGLVFLFEPKSYYLFILWTMAAVFSSVVLVVWALVSENIFTGLMTNSQFPYPQLSYAFFMGIGGAGVLILCTIISGILMHKSSNKAWEQKQELIENEILRAPQKHSLRHESAQNYDIGYNRGSKSYSLQHPSGIVTYHGDSSPSIFQGNLRPPMRLQRPSLVTPPQPHARPSLRMPPISPFEMSRENYRPGHRGEPRYNLY